MLWDGGHGGYGVCMQNDINTGEKSLGALGMVARRWCDV